jgi:hypothetical protein
MSINSKALGVVMIAVFLASAMLASAAHAEEEKTPTFTATSTPVRETGTATESHTITSAAGAIKCTEANLLDSAGNGGMMLLMKPSYGGCTVAGLSVTVNMNGCEYTFEPIKTIGEDHYTGRMGIQCPSEKVIEISFKGCLITIGGQINLETVEYTNNTKAEPAKDETWRTEVKKVVYMQTGTGCNGGNLIGELTYKGTETVKGESAETLEPIGLWIGD